MFKMTTTAPIESISEIGKVLQDKSKPLKDRFRALFTLKNLGGSEAIDLIASCFDDGSALLKHELAYCLGQMQDKYAIPTLVTVLEDKTQEAMVRHEAGKCRSTKWPSGFFFFFHLRAHNQHVDYSGAYNCCCGGHSTCVLVCVCVCV